MNAIIFDSDVEQLRPVAEEWYKLASGNRLHIAIDIEAHLSDLKNLVDGANSDLLVLEDEGQIVGYMGIKSFLSPLSVQLIANEHYWYVMFNKRGIGSMMLLHLAKAWAKVHGCSHLIMNASNLASDLHDKVCKMYDHIGMKKFETSFIMEI